MRYLIIFILTVFVYSSPDISTYGCPNPEQFGYSYVSGTVDISPDGNVYDCSSSFTPTCTSSQSTYGDYEIWTLRLGGKLRGDEYSSSNKCRVTASNLSGLIEYRKCNRPDEPLQVPDGYSNPFPIMESSSPTGVCPGVDTDLSTQCVDNGGVILTARSSCCSINYCALPENSTTNNDCAPDEHYDNTQEACVCNNGYPKINGQCQKPECPQTYDSLPLFDEVDREEDCHPFPLADYSYLKRPDGVICCYGQKDIDHNDTCPTNSIEINGQCYEIQHDDQNDTSNKHDCPFGQYWSYLANDGEGGCLDMFPENNNTNGSNDQSSGTGTNDGNTGGTSTGDDPAEGAMTEDEYKQGLSEFSTKLQDFGNKALNNYVLIKLPVTVTGTCSNEFRKTFNILGKSYTIDLSPYFAKLNEINSYIYGLVMFVFAISGIVIVLSNRGD